MMPLTRRQASDLIAPSFKFGLFTAAFLFAYYRTLFSMIKIWANNGSSSHGFIIPLISLYLVWYKRRELKSIPVKPNMLWGSALTFVGGAAGLIGTISGVITVQSISIVIIIPGLVWMFFGNGYLKALALPLMYLLLMPPIVDLFAEQIYWPCQLSSTTIAAWLLQSFQISTSQYLQYLQLPHITLEVTKQCSGMHILIALVAVAILLAYLTQREWWKKIILVVLAVIIGIATNGMRVAFIGIWTYFGNSDIEGAYHIFNGLLMSAIGFSLLFLFAGALDKIPSKGMTNTSKSDSFQIRNVNGNKHELHAPWLVAMVVLLVLGSYEYFYSPKPQSLKTPMSELPLMIGDWRGKDINSHMIPFRPPGTDSELARVYCNASGREVELYIGYFESQREGKALVSYIFQEVYDMSKEVKIPLRDSRNFMRVNTFSRQADGRRRFILYCYNIDGRIISSRYQARLLTAFDGFMHGRTNGAVIMIFNEGEGSSDPVNGQHDAIGFMQELAPLLEGHFL